MKKNLFHFFLVALFLMPAAVWAIPIHNINLNMGIALPGETEIAAYYNVASLSESIRTYNIGLSYDFAPLEFISIGAGCNFALRPFVMLYKVGVTPYEDTVNFNSIEPFVQLRFYLPVMEGFDLFAGGGAGYAMLIGSSIAGGLGPKPVINGGGLTYKFGGGIAYNQGMFTAIMDIGYKVASITPSPAITSPIPPLNPLVVNLGGLYFTMGMAISIGNQKEAKNEGEIKKQLDKEVNNLDAPAATDDGSGEVKTESSSTEPVMKNTEGVVIQPKRTQEESFIDSASVESTPLPAATAVEAAAKPEATEVVNTETAEPVKTETAQADESADDTDGIIIISPGESETSELEKYIVNKSKQFRPVEEDAEAEADSGEDVTFDYGGDDAGVIVVEAESKGTVDKAGFVLVEKGGFISSNFAEDGFIYSLDEHKELLSAGDFAYIKLTAGIGAPKGKQFSIFTDSEEVMNQATGEPMGKMIKFMGVIKVVGNIEDNIFKVQITKSYEPIINNYKIKARNDLKKYHKEINLKVRKKSLEVRAFIVKVKDDVMNLKSRDLVYIDAGIAKGLLPGEKMGIFRQTTDNVSGKVSEYDRIGTVIIINAMQGSSVGLIIKTNGRVNVGDLVKTLGK